MTFLTYIVSVSIKSFTSHFKQLLIQGTTFPDLICALSSLSLLSFLKSLTHSMHIFSLLIGTVSSTTLTIGFDDTVDGGSIKFKKWWLTVTTAKIYNRILLNRIKSYLGPLIRDN